MQGGGRCGLAYRRPKTRKVTPADSKRSPRTARRSEDLRCIFHDGTRAIWIFLVVVFFRTPIPAKAPAPARSSGHRRTRRSVRKFPSAARACQCVRWNTRGARQRSRWCRAGPEARSSREDDLVAQATQSAMQGRQGSCRPRSAPTKARALTAASARTSGWRSRHAGHRGARSPASRTDRTGG